MTYMNVVLCAHTCVGARTHVMGCTQQRTNNTHLVEKNPFFMAGVVERTGTGRNNPCSASTTLLIFFRRQHSEHAHVAHSRCNWVYEQYTFNTNTCKHHHISYYSLGGKSNAKTIVWNIRGHLMLECFSLCNVVASLSYGGRR
jgi:hypothetical protein